MRESFIIYRSFYEIIKLLPPKKRLQMLEAMMDFGFEQQEPTFSDVAQVAIWSTIKPQLIANYKRFTNGAKGKEYGGKGGRPKTPKSDTNETPNDTQNESLGVKNKTPSVTPNENERENKSLSNVNVNDNISLSSAGELELSQNLNAFLNLHKNITIDSYNGEFGEIDFNLLHKEINLSDWLQQITSFSWLCQNYKKVIAGKYRKIITKNQEDTKNESMVSRIDKLE